jgi:hypothetical protein
MKPIRFTVITSMIVVSIVVFCASAIIAVSSYHSRTDNNCAAVKALRDDLVQVVKDGETRSQHTITTAFRGKTRTALLKNLHDQTDRTVAKIQTPNCP